MRRLVIALFLYVIVEGALRKWVLPDYGAFLFALKDVILSAAFLILVGQRWAVPYWASLPSRKAALVAVIAWCALSLVLFAIGNLSLPGLLGLRYYIFPMLLLFTFPWIVRDLEDMNDLAKKYVVIAAGLSALTFVQFASPADSEVNAYAWRSSDIDAATFGVEDMEERGRYRVRVTGTFSYISPYASFLLFVFLCALARICQPVHGRQALQLGACIVLIGMCIFMTGSRATVLSAAILLVPFSLLIVRRHRWGVGWLSVVGIAMFFGAIETALQVFVQRSGEAGDEVMRVMGSLWTPIGTFQGTSFLGEGIGSTFGGFGELQISTLVADTSFNEIVEDRIGVELGYFGYLVLLSIKIYFLVEAARLYFRLADIGPKAWALVSVGYQASFVWQIPFYNATAAYFYFACIAIHPFLEYEVWRTQYGARARVGPSRPSLSSGWE